MNTKYTMDKQYCGAGGMVGSYGNMGSEIQIIQFRVETNEKMEQTAKIC